MNRQTAHIDRNEVAAKVTNGQALSLAELSVYTGVAYSVVRSWHWLPKIGGFIFFDDFVIARRRATGLEPDPRIVVRRPRSNADKFG